ncbi:MAG: U32 family peptidase C-terminal domain-containing protein, partial [Clostridiales bacterium]
ALGDEIEILLPDGRNIALLLEAIYDENNLPIDKAPHPKQAISIPFSGEKLPLPAIIRRKQRY